MTTGRAPGWDTNGATRSILLDFLKMAIEGVNGAPGWLEVHDPVFWAECLTFVRGPSGKYEAQGGDTHDDSVFGVGIALQVMEAPQPNIREFA